MKLKSMFKNPVKGVKDTFEDVRNPGKAIKRDFKAVKKDIQNPGEAISDRWENFKDNPGVAFRPDPLRGPFSQARPGGPGAPAMPGGEMHDLMWRSPDFPSYMPPKNTRISPGIYATGTGGTVRSRMAPGPVDTRWALPPGLPPRPEGQPWFGPGKPLITQGAADLTPSEQRIKELQDRGMYIGAPGFNDSQVSHGRIQPAESVPYGSTQTGRYAPGATPANTRGDAMRTTPAKGTRISPGVYADGRGGQTLKTPNVIPRAPRR